MPREMMFAEAIAVAITEEMQRDANVVFYGQNMAMTDRDPFVRKFGKDRVRITPISETAELGIAVGAAMMGLRPIVELYMSEFMLVAFDEVINEAPRMRYMSGGQVKVPTVFKAGFGFAAGWAGQHSNCIYGPLMGIPGLKVAVPSTAADALGLMKSAIRDDNPVVYLHHYMLMLDKCPVPDGDYLVPFGVADIKRPGTDVTIVATAWMVKKSLAAAEMLAKDGITLATTGAYGKGLGRTLGFPTANLHLMRRKSPTWGVIAVRVHGIDARPRDGVASLGTRPTVNGVEPLLEVHVFDFRGDLYGRLIEVEFIAKLRDEVKFDSVDAMVAQMKVDAANARELLSKVTGG